MKQIRIAFALVLCLLAPGCGQTTTEKVIQDGAEAATVAAVLTLRATLPLEAPVIIAGMTKVTGAALQILDNPIGVNMTLQQILDLEMITDPNLAKYKALIQFVLPILKHVPGVQAALNYSASDLPVNIRNDVTAFFRGMNDGLNESPEVTVDFLLSRNPKLRAAMANIEPGEFDVNALANALLAADQDKGVPMPRYTVRQLQEYSVQYHGCRNGHCSQFSNSASEWALPSGGSSGDWDSDGDGHGQGCYK